MADRSPESEKRATLPLFPLQAVLMPGAHLPLHIFEPRYRQLTVDLMNEVLPDRQFGIIAIKTSMVREVEGPQDLFDVGCSAELREAKSLPDGRFDIVTTGRRPFRLLDVDTTAAPYLMGTVEWLADAPVPKGADEATERLSSVARSAHRQYCDSAWESDDWSTPPHDTDVEDLAYLLAADCLLPLADQQRLLEERQPLRRLRLACRLLTREAGFLSTLRAVPAPPTGEGALSTPGSLN
ncbi:LON peptidase substrate-binding domain-containing protein [Amycolatopsis palatopharyngis]|uniref:LON peptidase substrate-binding domain-containing protein n=1 Tax=Amycolatopsis palatopharyngis TaxID=187982 RepID=UPI000E23D555|nr:LON peptidase substrate-binding domain-containing protein [Amycolatopsis palatopharyngis]